MKKLLPVIFSLALTALSLNSNAQSAADSFSKLKINTDTPEGTLSSWWAIVDARYMADYQECKKEPSITPESRRLAFAAKSQIASVALTDVFEYNRKYVPICHHRVFVRTISQQQQVTSSRVEILVNIKDATAMPAGTVLTGPYSIEPRTLGKEYKYVLLKEKNKWLISDVQVRDPLGGFHPTRDWSPEYKKQTPSFFTYIMEQ